MIPIAKPFVGQKEEDAVLGVLRSGMLAQGKKVKELEEKFAKFCNSKYAIATNNGTSALHAALYALGIGKGDEVITTPFTFVATANAIIMQGAKPVFVDIEDETFNIDPSKIEQKITSKTKAIIPVDLFGHMHDYKKIAQIANKHDLKILTDACQSVGAKRDSLKSGECGNASAFSFYATKNMMCGEGGMITTDDENVNELARRFRHHGQSAKTRYQYADLGYNYRMTDLQAAIALVQLDRIEEFTKQRNSNAQLLSSGLINSEQVRLPIVRANSFHAYHQYSVLVPEEKRDLIVQGLKDKGVGCAVFYPKPLHLHPHFERLGYSKGDFPISERIAKQILSLPVHPQVTKENILTIVKCMGELI